jgi:hypothetical protein
METMFDLFPPYMMHIVFPQSQIHQSLINYVEKNVKIYNFESVLLIKTILKYVIIWCAFGIIDVDIFFYILVKL